MAKKIIVLGAGMVGRTMAKDLAGNYEVYSADLSKENLALLADAGITTLQADLGNADTLRGLIADKDLVIGAVPGFMGFKTLQTVIACGKNVCDISFFPEDPFLLDADAKKHNVTAVVDCGVAPGMDNIILGYHNARMEVETFTCLVGGLPRERRWPFEYKAPFSPADVIEEYVRPARYMKNGKMEIRPALSDPDLVDFTHVGTLEAFNSDGLRTLLYTMPHIPDMVERTLRYPGHIALMRVFRETGFFGTSPLKIKDVSVRPLDVTAALLFPEWKLTPGEEEFTVMRVHVAGREDGAKVEYIYDLYDVTDPETGTSSMARTTGYTCTAAAHLLLNGGYAQAGINPPEFLGTREENFRALLRYLEERNVVYYTAKHTLV